MGWHDVGTHKISQSHSTGSLGASAFFSPRTPFFARSKAEASGEKMRFARAALLSAAVLLPTGGTADLSACGAHARHTRGSAFVAPSAPAGLSRVAVGAAQRRLGCGHGSYEAAAPAARRARSLQLCMMADPSADAPVREAPAAGRQGSAKATDYYKPLVEGDILESTDEQRTIVGFSYLALAALFVKGLVLLPPMDAGVALATVLSVLVGYEFADIGSGVYHWSMDNYGSKNTPVFGTQIEAFQGHHELPWTITYRQVCNNIYKICQATAPFCIAGILFVNNPYVLIWMATAISFINLSQVRHPAQACWPTPGVRQGRALARVNVCGPAARAAPRTQSEGPGALGSRL